MVKCHCFRHPDMFNEYCCLYRVVFNWDQTAMMYWRERQLNILARNSVSNPLVSWTLDACLDDFDCLRLQGD